VAELNQHVSAGLLGLHTEGMSSSNQKRGEIKQQRRAPGITHVFQSPVARKHKMLQAQGCIHQRASYASGDFDAKCIPGIAFLIPGIAKIQFTVLRSCGFPNSPFVNFVLAYS
jgi:hypothetical protein